MTDENAYLPHLARIVNVKEEVPGIRAIKTFRVEFLDGGGFEHEPGQCAMISVFGKGKSDDLDRVRARDQGLQAILHHALGRVTTAIHDMKAGDVIGVRGPYGNKFPVHD